MSDKIISFQQIDRIIGNFFLSFPLDTQTTPPTTTALRTTSKRKKSPAAEAQTTTSRRRKFGFDGIFGDFLNSPDLEAKLSEMESEKEKDRIAEMSSSCADLIRSDKEERGVVELARPVDA
mmetsp:Transcript_15407/g.22890  ORF Transcript_15407/g.22890 Transcript_15407/m.22890 type:complete len:121 (-) Transcript_15407:208-570(-)